MSFPFSLTAAVEPSAESAIRDFVLHRLPLGLYDAAQPVRPRLPVASFDLEVLEFDPEGALAHAAGPVVLRTADGDVEQYLRVSVGLELGDGGCRIAPEGESRARAVYIVDLGSETGACKETAALANA